MCIYISMSIIEKVFKYEENEITVIKCRGEIWFRGKDIAKALGLLRSLKDGLRVKYYHLSERLVGMIISIVIC